jgi:hypothetical protein
MIVLPGGGYAEHAPHEAEPIADWLGQIGVPASVFRYPLHTRHPVPLEVEKRASAKPVTGPCCKNAPMIRTAWPLTSSGAK